ncbi:predicted protein [Histoplasma capsulatum G186AR]|uniref:Uncharacterized protein n=1 Tax=Ajellomyces capsulatus (strain G186AR / H82 / ATCC MYA-2454 / RMSCC 2432) TaxID=447093 RepID=C0NI94_AJECG|nr:uncharacterized protein HCBG_03066 [Histoplasma capsulatum G186AR]EEH09529.1 predicted protein [Histoplasma capsulatum G186AR]
MFDETAPCQQRPSPGLSIDSSNNDDRTRTILRSSGLLLDYRAETCTRPAKLLVPRSHLSPRYRKYPACSVIVSSCVRGLPILGRSISCALMAFAQTVTVHILMGRIAMLSIFQATDGEDFNLI